MVNIIGICVTFQNRLGDQRVKSAQGTIKILLKSDFSSDLTHFLAIIGGGGGGRGEGGGGGVPSQRDIKVRP